MAIERHIWASATALLLIGCSDHRWIAPPIESLGTLIAIREEGRADLAMVIGLPDGERLYLEPAQEMVWLAYSSSLEGLNVSIGAPPSDHPSRALRDDPALTTPSDVFELTASGPLEWARRDAVPAWALELSAPYATPPPCPTFGRQQFIELPEVPGAIAIFQGRLVAAHSSTRALAIVDAEDPPSIVTRRLGAGPPITALFAIRNTLFLGDDKGMLWRMASTEPDAIPSPLGTVSSSSCAVAAMDGPDDGSEVITVSKCLEVALWSSTTGRTTLLNVGPPPRPVTPIQIAWAGPSEAVTLAGDGVGPKSIRRVTGAINTERLAPSFVPDSIARLERGLRIAAHGVAASSEQSLHCPTLGCGTKTPDAGPGDWEVDLALPLLIDHVERMVAFEDGLVFAATSGKIGFFSPSAPSCRPSPAAGLGHSVAGLDQEDGRIVYSANATTVGLVELSE